jgi:hypothetical protein
MGPGFTNLFHDAHIAPDLSALKWGESGLVEYLAWFNNLGRFLPNSVYCPLGVTTDMERHNASIGLEIEVTKVAVVGYFKPNLPREH